MDLENLKKLANYLWDRALTVLFWVLFAIVSAAYVIWEMLT